MLVEQNHSGSGNCTMSGYGCCRAEWENAPQPAPALPSQDDLGQGQPQYYLPCSD